MLSACFSVWFDSIFVFQGTIILPDGRVKRCCSDNGECTSTFDYCLRNTCAYCSEEPRKENPLRLKFAENMSMIFCEAACLRGYLDCRLQRPPKSVHSQHLISSQVLDETSNVNIGNNRLNQNAGSSVPIGYPVQQCQPMHDLHDGRIQRSALNVTVPLTNNGARNVTSTSEMQVVVPRKEPIQSSNRSSYNVPISDVGSPATLVVPNTYDSTSSGAVVRTSSVSSSQERGFIQTQSINKTLGNQSHIPELTQTADEDDEDIQVINVIKEKPAATTAIEIGQSLVTTAAVSSLIPPVPTKALRLDTFLRCASKKAHLAAFV